MRLSRTALTPDLYFPYLCPWTIQGHLSLFTAREGYLTGRCYPGMAGGPVMDGDGKVVGVLLGGEPSPEHPQASQGTRKGMPLLYTKGTVKAPDRVERDQ